MKTTPMTPQLYDYVIQHCDTPHPILAEVAQLTSGRADSVMQISADQGMWMHLMVKFLGAKRILEIGCFTGYSSICMASALGKDGKLVALDINPETAKIAQDFFSKAGLKDKIELRIAPATESLNKLLNDLGEGSFDLIFIDADKENLVAYYESGLKLIRAGGVILVDNVIWDGKILNSTDQSEATNAIRRFNHHARNDSRVEKVFLHISDGIYVLRKK